MVKKIGKNFLETGTIVSTKTGSLLIGWGKRHWRESYDDQKELSFYFPDYFLSLKKPWFTHENYQELSSEELIDILESIRNPQTSKLEWENFGKQLFSEAFQDLQRKFASNILKKGVPFIFETAKGTMNQARLRDSLLCGLQYARSNPIHIYGFWNQEEGILGATPELLFSLNADSGSTTLETVACAGTCPREEAANFAQDPKQLHEHHLVVEGIIESLSPIGEVKRGDIKVLTLPTLCHLVTPIAVNIQGKADFGAIVRSLHPTPALGAYPKIPGMRWLKNYQTKIDRRRFGAPVGYFWNKKNEAASYVAIRNVQWFTNALKIGAGCGIVAQSQLDLEWEEIQLKVQSIKNIFVL